MEQNSKYYTPSIEEFHIGFEYEFRTGDVWEPLIWRGDVTIMGRVLKNLIRVKCLDRSDIEDLGFEYDRIEDDDIWFKWTREDFPSCDDYLVYDIKHKCISIGNFEPFEERMIVNDIRIKNKSELKKLLKMLGINGD